MVDVLFVPVGGNGYTLDAIGALKIIKKIEPKIIIPTHYADKAIKYEVPQADLDEVMKTHCRIGADAICSAMTKVRYEDTREGEEFPPVSRLFFTEAEKIALSHHERWDGSGYPQGLKGEEIPLSALLMALADVFDALTTVRIYKKAWSPEDAYDHILAEREKHFSPDIVDAFIAERAAFEHTLLSMTSIEERGN